MDPSLVSLLACPRDGDYPLHLAIDQLDSLDQVLSGSLRCAHCGSTYSISGGIPDLCELGRDPDEVERKESEILARDREAAESYDRMFTNYQNSAERNALLRHLHLESTHRVLELGSGTGRMTCHLIERCGQIVCIDFSLTSLQILRKRLAGKAVHLIRADVNHLPLRKGPSFDRVVSSQLLEHLPSKSLRDGMLRSCVQVLAPDGRFVLTAYNFSVTKSRRGFPKEGYHSSGIFYHCYKPDELAADMAKWFRVHNMSGVLNRFTRVRLLERFGNLGAVIDGVISRTKISLATGHLLLAVGFPLTSTTSL